MESTSLAKQNVEDGTCAMSLYSKYVPLYMKSMNMIPSDMNLSDDVLNGIVQAVLLVQQQ